MRAETKRYVFKPRLRKARIREDSIEAANCIGFTYRKLGLTVNEIFIHPGPLRDHFPFFDVTQDVDQADVIVVDSADTDKIRHMAVVDPASRAFVLERQHTGLPVRKVPVNVSLSYHQEDIEDGKSTVKYLKVNPWIIKTYERSNP
jgi:hypothetical protein